TPLPSIHTLSLHDALPIYLFRAFTPQAISDFCLEASRACETEVVRRFMPFTLTESRRAEGVDPDELGVVSPGLMDLTTTLGVSRSEEHTSELQSPDHLVCR